MATIDSTKFNLYARTDDDFSINVEAGVDISTFTPKLIIGAFDASEYITTTSATAFIIKIPALLLKTMGIGSRSYSCLLDLGGNSRELLFSGLFETKRGAET